jgi:hypothetical protein
MRAESNFRSWLWIPGSRSARPGMTGSKILLHFQSLRSVGQITKTRQARFAKYSDLQNIKSGAHFLRPAHRGALRNVINAGRDAVDARRRFDECVACGRRSRVVLTPRRWCQVSGSNSTDDGGKKARSPGRARRKPLKPLRREGRNASAETVCSCAFCMHFCTRDRGCSAHPAFPAPSLFRGSGISGKARTHCAARMRSHILSSLRAKRSNPWLSKVSVDCFAPLAMTLVGCLKIESELSSLRTQGPITTGSWVVRKSSSSVSHDRRHGVWVPACAGTTLGAEPVVVAS